MATTRTCSFNSARALSSTFNIAKTNATIPPSFLLPALATSRFSTSASRQSKIGRSPLSLPPDVTFTLSEPPRSDPLVEVVGPLGKLSMTIPRFVKIEEIDDGKGRAVTVEKPTDKMQRTMWGTVRAYLANHVLGVSEGHTAILRLIGVGYRATVEKTATTVQPEYDGQQFVSLKVGYSHPIELGVPRGVKASTPQPTRILLEGIEKEVVMQFAAEIRAWRKPEPYKGKGIFVNGETIRLKAKKIK